MNVMKRKTLMLAAALAAGTAAHAAIVATADHSDARYKVGETAHFRVSVTPDRETAPTGTVTVVVYDSGDRRVAERAFDYSGTATFKVPVAMDRPGFWRCGADVTVGAEPGKVRSAWGIACEPEKIRDFANHGTDLFADALDGRPVPRQATVAP